MQARYSGRVPINCGVVFAGEQAAGEGRVLNLSLPGCLIESSKPLAAGEYLRLRLFLPKSLRPLNVPLAAVRWSQGGRAGVEFIQTAREEQAQLTRFFRQQSSRADEDERDIWQSERTVNHR
ncbi:MAG: hypothetical protein NBKEAIPA_02453 [Nitrospirae bacterium]|nr:MAG: PilZ domain protein [Nitrospira sp. OLB3]MBV6470537.1 hypothetical protein [Nitrospirota bacterium]MCE7965693.1 PilZ domain-containing protein [Nitrospira sp. NTP2]MCK6493083.1 PilZ domain-containing protein [Nitrospira sp.]MEB2338557.1 PilZ domain-containing protein [Nitrospirales bacterium]